MGEFKQLTASDGHVLSAYQASPAETPVGAIVLLQEIFGINFHIQSVADRFAGEGYLVLAPALFDRVERGVELKYEGEDAQKAYSLMQQLKPETALLDIAAAYASVKQAGKGIAVIGFCYGGMMSWLTATRGDELKMRPDCCVGYYPGGIGNFASEQPSCPVLLHFGLDDSHIGPGQVEAVRAAHPEVTIYTYESAQHGFNCDARASFNPEASRLARERTLAFLKENVS